MTSYDIGDRRKLSATITDEDGALIDPDTLIFKIKLPDGTVTTYTYGTDVELVRDSIGVFHVYWDVETAGGYWWRFAASGNVGAAEEAYFSVQSSRF